MRTRCLINYSLPQKTVNEIEKSLIRTYKKEIFSPFVKAINEFNLIEENDKVAIAISGGKDSLILAKLFQELKRHNKFAFELVFIAMDPGFHEVNKEILVKNCEYLNIPVEIRKSNIFSVCEEIAKENPCYLCARMRRGFLYNFAKELGCNKIALGHHFDDVIETTMLNVLYGGQFKTMPPKIQAKNFKGIQLIRPMVFIKERDIKRWITASTIKAMDCGCAVAAQKTSSKRREIKNLIENLRKINPRIESSIFASACNVNLDAVYGYITNGIAINYNEIFSKINTKEDD